MIPFKKEQSVENEGGKRSSCENHDTVLAEEVAKHPVTTAAKIETNKLVNAFTKYPQKGFIGSKNSNFYEYLTMGKVPFIAGSLAMIGMFTGALSFYDTPDSKAAGRKGTQVAIGVLGYALAKTLSKKLIELPVKWKHGIDMNLPYKKVISELPEVGYNMTSEEVNASKEENKVTISSNETKKSEEENAKDRFLTYEYHKVYESVDFPRWDILYNTKDPEKRNEYYDKIAKKMKLDNGGLVNSDQKVKSKIKEKVTQARMFSTLVSYLWAGVAVAVASQEPFGKVFDNLTNKTYKGTSLTDIIKIAKNNKGLDKFKDKAGYVAGELKNSFTSIPNRFKGLPKRSLENAKDFGSAFVKSCKEFVSPKNHRAAKYAGRALLGAAVGVTLLGNIVTLFDFNKDKGSKTQASASLIDNSKEKVVC